MSRGRPPKITPDRYDEVIDLIRSGLSMAAVAAQLRVARATLYNLADGDPAMGEAIRRAQVAVRAERAAARHGTESCYVNSRCREPACVAAASEARGRRRTAPTPHR